MVDLAIESLDGHSCLLFGLYELCILVLHLPFVLQSDGLDLQFELFPFLEQLLIALLLNADSLMGESL